MAGIGIALAYAVLGVLVFQLYSKACKSKRLQDQLVEALGGSGEWTRVMLARPPFFARRWKILGFEARGLIINTPDAVRIIGDPVNGERIDRTWSKNDLHIEWLGNAALRSANLHWIAIGSCEDRLFISADTGFNALQSREATADLCRKVAPNFQLPAIAKAEFALEKNSRSLTIVVLFFCIIAYAFLDGVIINKNKLLTSGGLQWMLPVVGALGSIAYPFLVRGKVPSRESMTLSMLLAMALLGSAVPLLKRADQLLAGGSERIQFTLKEQARLEPVVCGPPTLNYDRYREYWEQFEQGSAHEFTIIHGPLGLWQVDEAELRRKMRVFYESNEAG